MARLVWDNETERKYTTGVSKGVFFDGNGKGHAWSGLISVTEKPQTNEPTAIYNSLGQKYDQYGNVAEKKHGLSCYTYPEAMDEFLGYEYLEEVGFSVDERPPKKFHMAYRVELGNGLYEIHVLLNQIATFGETNRSTLSNSPSLSTITMNLTGAADPRYGASHIVLDSRLPITESAETILFGDKFNDSNINDFLDAEPTWETVAVNYAPIIEPDYDNMVWLGKENLITRIRDVNAPLNHDSSYVDILLKDTSLYYVGNIYHESHNFTIGDTITVTVKGYVPPGRSGYRLYATLPNGNVINMGGMMRYDGNDIYRQTYTFTESLNSPTYIRLYSALNQDEAQENPGDIRLEWVKLERGSTATPWTPAPSDPNQKPLPTDPHPINYKPAAKKVSLAHNIPTANAVLYYDELTSGLGVYSKTDGTANSNRILYMPYVANGTSVRLNHLVSVRNVSGPTNSYLGRLGLGRPTVYSPLPQYPGTYESGLSEYTFDLSLFPTAHMIFQNGGASGAAEVAYSNMLLTLSGYKGEFFDANSTPPNKGTKYVRVETATHDYTLKQELRLRSKSRVRIYDQTSYDYWLEADDSQLIRQNETFTFSGPQAEITGDTFTIDDEILGSEGF